jgi:hypothetical protein
VISKEEREALLRQKQEEALAKLRVSYRSCFTAPGAGDVLQDLAEFCCASQSCVAPNNHYQTLVFEGRREAFLRIQNFMNLTAAQLARLRFGPQMVENDNG